MVNHIKNGTIFVMLLFAVLCFMPINSYAATNSETITMAGSGTKSDPYQISTKYQLDEVRYDLDAHYILVKDIVFTEDDFKANGDFYNNAQYWRSFTGGSIEGEAPGFKGSFDGNNHTIYGIKFGGSSDSTSIFGKCINATIMNLNIRNAQSNGPIIAYYSSNTEIVNCTIKDSNIKGYGGAFVGMSFDSEFSKCINHACIENIDDNEICGGIVASGGTNKFVDCVNCGNINSNLCAGGIIGYDTGASIILECENYGNITTTAVNSSIYGFTGAYAGGIGGYVLKESNIKTSFNNGSITAKTNSYSSTAVAGGIVGENRGAIVDCYNSGIVVCLGTEEEMVGNAGGLAGVCANNIINSFNTGNVQSVYRAGGITAYLKGESARISKCYNVGDISAAEVVSGVASQVSGGATISNTYYLDESVNGYTSQNISNYYNAENNSVVECVSNDETQNNGPVSYTQYLDKGIIENSNISSNPTDVEITEPILATTATIKKNGTALTKTQMKKKSSYKNFDFSSKWTISSSNNYQYPILKKVSYKPQVKITGLNLNLSKLSIVVNDKYRLSVKFTPANTTNKLVKWTSDNSKVVKVDATGKITALKEGTATITCKSLVGGKTATCKVTVVKKLVKLSETKYVYDGEQKTPDITVEGDGGKQLTKGTDFDVTYDTGRIKVGRYKVTVTFKGKYDGEKCVYFTIVPKAPATAKTKLTSYYGEKAGYNDIRFSWSKVTGASGYTVYYKKASASNYTYLTRTTKTYVYKKNLDDGVKYTFKVVPYYKSGDNRYSSLSSKTASVYTLKEIAKPKVVKSGTKVKVSWENINGESGYEISRSTSKNGTNIVATYSTTSGTSKVISATKGKTYYYKVRAYKIVGDEKVYAPWSSVTAYKR